MPVRAPSLDSEDAPFLPLEEHSAIGSRGALSKQQKVGDYYWLRPFLIRPWLLHAIIIFIYSILALTYVHRQTCPESLAPTSLSSLDRHLTKTLFHNLSNSAFSGRPSDETDAAWDALLKPMHLRISAEELRRDNQESVSLSEAGGFLGWLGVFHEVHCVRMLQRAIYSDHGQKNKTEEEEKHDMSHIDHCIDILRQASLCHADASLTTFIWHPEKRRPMFNASESEHTCVDWKRLMASVEDRVVSEEEILRLENPLMESTNP